MARRGKNIIISIAVLIFVIGLIGFIADLLDYRLEWAGMEIGPEIAIPLMIVGAVIGLVYLIIALVAARRRQSE
ncbi:MAG: hypothetical protein GF399_08515 [Candidatus Coatesbacteria bacterium]|nr:hypothetical protein [Candidatus Coatesbacteria bacterium]